MAKPSLADVAIMEPAADDSAASSTMDDGDDYGAALDELAEVLNVPADKMDAFRDAFQAACMSCK